MSLPWPSQRPVEAIVIGTSAGGVDALSTILPRLPAGLVATVLVVIHLPRERPSLLAEIFAPKCALPVVEAQDKEPLQPGTIHFAPPDYHLLVDHGPEGALASLSADPPVNWSRPSIDVLFESAADIYRARLLGLILTGSSHDGAAGLQAVHRAGGYTVVQRPDQAQAPAMSEAALRLTAADQVLSLPEIAEFFQSLPSKDAS